MKVVLLLLVATLVERSYGVVGIAVCDLINPCSQICTPVGPFALGIQCSCEPGFQVSAINHYDCVPIGTACDPGYYSFKGLCVDTDECASSPCQHTCTNSIGSYSCSCNSGYQPVSGDSSRCEPIAATCQPGYQPNPANLQQCIDIDECATNNPCDQRCTNLQGSYQCSCNSGYAISDRNRNQCEDIDECASSPCQHTCTNNLGGYSCSCNSGYQPVSGDSSRCEPIAAICQPGYQPNPANLQQCIDIDECARNNPCNQSCTNLQGSYRCSCNEGYAISDRNRNQCEAITICTNPRDIVFVIDSSGSMDKEEYRVELQFIANLVSHFAVGPNNARFAAVVVGENVKEVFALRSKKTVQAVVKAILDAPHKQKISNTHLALDFIRKQAFLEKNGGRQIAPDIAFVVKSGQSNNRLAAEQSAAALRNTGVEIIALGIGNEVNVEELRKLATSDSHVFTSPTLNDLPYVEQRLAAILCSG